MSLARSHRICTKTPATWPVRLRRLRNTGRPAVVERRSRCYSPIRVALGSYEGTPTFSVWRGYRTPTGELRPCRGRLVIGLRHLPALGSAVQSALTTARELGVLPSP